MSRKTEAVKEESVPQPKREFDTAEWLKQHFDDPARELPDYPTLEDRITLFEGEVGDLKQQVKNLQTTLGDIDEWFRKHVGTLASDAVKEFVRLRSVAEAAIESQAARHERLEFEKNVHNAVESKFSEEAPKLAKAIFDAIRNQIQPHALRR